MHWGFYVVAALVTALAIYVQMKRIEKTEKQDEQSNSTAAPVDRKAKPKHKQPAK